MEDNVNHPAHYAAKFKTRQIECIDITRHMPFCAGNAFKYVWRAGDKGGREKAIEDLNKAIFYLREADEAAHGAPNPWYPNPYPHAKLIFDVLTPEDTPRYNALRAIAFGAVGIALEEIKKLKEEIENAD